MLSFVSFLPSISSTTNTYFYYHYQHTPYHTKKPHHTATPSLHLISCFISLPSLFLYLHFSNMSSTIVFCVLFLQCIFMYTCTGRHIGVIDKEAKQNADQLSGDNKFTHDHDTSTSLPEQHVRRLHRQEKADENGESKVQMDSSRTSKVDAASRSKSYEKPTSNNNSKRLIISGVSNGRKQGLHTPPESVTLLDYSLPHTHPPSHN